MSTDSLDFDDLRLYLSQSSTSTNNSYQSNYSDWDYPKRINIEDMWSPIIDSMQDHPSYRDRWLETILFILDQDGPLPPPMRHYVAIMAASRHNNRFLLQSLMRRLANFLEDLNVPINQYLQTQMCTKRYISLCKVNRILAHQPWMISPSDIALLCGVNEFRNAQWSIPQLHQAAVIMSHIHALCSFVCGVGITNDSEDLSSSSPKSDNSSEGDKTPKIDESVKDYHESEIITEHEKCRRKERKASASVDVLMQRMEELQKIQFNQNNIPEKSCAFTEVVTESSKSKKNSKKASPTIRASEKTQTDDILKNAIDQMSIDQMPTEGQPLLTMLMKKQDLYDYIDFCARADKKIAPTLKSHDFSWVRQGYSILAQTLQEMADVLDDKFRLIQQLTYHTMGCHSGVKDTSPFRIAVWNYAQCLFGIRHDDYDYSVINKLLSRPLKTFIKNVACFPQRVTDEQRMLVMKDFHESEKIHVVLLTMEARCQAELLYFLRAYLRFVVRR